MAKNKKPIKSSKETVKVKKTNCSYSCDCNMSMCLASLFGCANKVKTRGNCVGGCALSSEEKTIETVEGNLYNLPECSGPKQQAIAR